MSEQPDQTEPEVEDPTVDVPVPTDAERPPFVDVTDEEDQ